MTALLELRDVSAGYDQSPVVLNVSFALESGESVALIGPNGCGKSTLIRAIVADTPHRTGAVLIRSEPVDRLETDEVARRGVGYLRQTRNVFSELSVRENLEMVAIAAGMPKRSDCEQALEDFPTLRRHLKVRAGLLSLGERQMLALAMVTMRPLALVLLDEPIAGLSNDAAAEFLERLSVQRSRQGFGLVIIEHQLALLQPHVSRVIVMIRGGIALDSSETTLLLDRGRLEKYYLL